MRRAGLYFRSGLAHVANMQELFAACFPKSSSEAVAAADGYAGGIFNLCLLAYWLAHKLRLAYLAPRAPKTLSDILNLTVRHRHFRQ